MIAAWAEAYPIEVFPSFWVKMTELIGTGRAGCISVVKDDLEKKNDDLTKWASQTDGLFHELSAEVQLAASAILADAKHQKLVDSVKGRSGSDPFVIALAKVHGACVVSQEGFARKKIKIPDVCSDMGIECINLLGMMRREGWTFG